MNAAGGGGVQLGPDPVERRSHLAHGVLAKPPGRQPARYRVLKDSERSSCAEETGPARRACEGIAPIGVARQPAIGSRTLT
jgi:hypothetical protein